MAAAANTSVAAALKVGDSVTVCIHLERPCHVPAFVVEPMKIGAGGSATMLVSMLTPNGLMEQRRVNARDVMLSGRRRTAGVAAPRLGDEDGLACTASSTVVEGGDAVVVDLHDTSGGTSTGSGLAAAARGRSLDASAWRVRADGSQRRASPKPTQPDHERSCDAATDEAMEDAPGGELSDEPRVSGAQQASLEVAPEPRVSRTIRTRSARVPCFALG